MSLPFYHRPLLVVFICCSFSIGLYSQTIQEKKDELEGKGKKTLQRVSNDTLAIVNREMEEKQKELKELYSEVETLYNQKAPEEKYRDLTTKIGALKESINLLDEEWRKTAIQTNSDEEYGLWQQPDTSIEQLIIDYGAQDYVYLVSPEIGEMKLSIDSNIPIPRSLWSEMLEIVLTQNGIGIRQLNPYLRELYILSKDKSDLKLITNKRQDLELFPTDTRIMYMLSPEPSEVRRVSFFLDKFVNAQTTSLQLVGRDILLIGTIGDVQDLLKLYDFVSTNRGDKEYKMIGLTRINAQEMAKILGAIFDQMGASPIISEKPSNQFSSKGTSSFRNEMEFTEENGLRIIVLENMTKALFLVGTSEEIKKAEGIIYEVENQLGDVSDKVVFWYTVKHSKAEDIADVLSRVYQLMVSENIASSLEESVGTDSAIQRNLKGEIADVSIPTIPQTLYGQEGIYQEGAYVVNPTPAEPGVYQHNTEVGQRGNFIVDAKTGSIIMVVEPEALAKLKDVIKKIDVPKKMVQIEVLFFEKTLNNDTSFGLNLLKIGSAASQTHVTSLLYNDVSTAITNLGLTQFLISRPKEHGVPAYDLACNFLISQADVQINSCPSVVTVNQTPAQIEIVDDISINTGVFEVETAKGVTLKDAFTRAQYGIWIEVTPTIHLHGDKNNEDCDDNDDTTDFITLETDITFDTILPNSPADRPNVARRHITNEVLIPNGQAVILGGLRRKETSDARSCIPFIGEIPGIGKLFSSTDLKDRSTEMFVFLTPKIIYDPVEDLERIKRQELALRPGDIPEYLCALVDAREREKTRLVNGSLRILFGRAPERCVLMEGAYDGR